MALNTSAGSEVESIKTLDATPTLIWNRTLSAGQFMSLRLTLVALKADGTVGAGFRREAYAQNLNGTTVLGAINTPYADVNTSGLAITFQASGTDIQVLATGLAATTITWRLIIEILAA